MIPTFEQMLVMGVAGFYLFDSTILLYDNEMVFIQTKKRWIFVYPDLRWQILGKILYVPNPLTPYRPLFRVHWFVSGSSKDHEDQQVLKHYLGSLVTLQHFTVVLLVLFFVGLPSVLFFFGADRGFLLLFGGIYVTIISMLILVYLHGEELQLSRKAFMKLAFDSLVCAPFALNLVRRITLRHPLDGDPISFAKRAFDDATFSRLVSVMFSRLDEELESEDEASPRYGALNDYRNRIASMSS